MTLPPCPMCGHNGNAVHNGGVFYCTKHKAFYDHGVERGVPDQAAAAAEESVA